MEAGTARPTEIFVGYAGESGARWQEALNLEVTHRVFGLGKIVKVDESVHVRFADGEKHFELPYLADPRFFTDMELPEHLETEALRKQRRSSARSRFAELCKEYQIAVDDETISEDEFFPILLKVHSGTRLEEEEVTWLEERGQFAALAFLYQKLFQKEGKPSDAIAAGQYWRKKGDLKSVIAWTKDIRFQDPEDETARLIVRAGAHRDGGALHLAEQCLVKALLLLESYPPLNVLGGIYWECGDFAQADQYFTAAAALGSTSECRDAEIRESLARSGGADRARIEEYLLSVDLERDEQVETGLDMGFTETTESGKLSSDGTGAD